MQKYILNWYELCLFGKEDWDAKHKEHTVHSQYVSVNQKHIDNIYYIQWDESCWENLLEEADAIISRKSFWKWIWVYMADCNNIAILWESYYWVVHCSWKTLDKWLLQNAINDLIEKWESTSQMHCFIWPSIRRDSYEVWNEFYDIFDKKYLTKSSGKVYFDMIELIHDIFASSWFLSENITLYEDCTFEQNSDWWSYRKWEVWCRNFLWVKSNL